MSNEPELTNLPIGHPLFTRTIYQSLAEITAYLLGSTTFVATALNQADLFANQGKPKAIALALGEAATYLEHSREGGMHIEELLDDMDGEPDEDPDNKPDENDEPNVMTLYQILPHALAVVDQSLQRINEAVDQYKDTIQGYNDPAIPSQETTLTYLRAATQTLEYHIEKTQEESTSTQIRQGHSLVAEATGSALLRELKQHQAQLELNRNRGDRTTERALQRAARQTTQALQTLTSTQPSRNQLIPMTCSYQISGQPHLKKQAEQLAQRYRDEGKLYIAHLPDPPDPNGVLIAYQYEGHILVQTMEDYYPEYFPKEQAEEHAGLIMNLTDDHPREEVKELVQRVLINHQAAAANIHTTPLEEVQELILMVLDATGQRNLAIDAAVAIADGYPELANELARPALEKENPVTLPQAREIVEKAQQAGIPTPVTRRICNAMGYQPQDLGITPLQVPWQQAMAILEATLEVRQDDETIRAIAAALNIDKNDPNFREWALNNMLDDLDDTRRRRVKRTPTSQKCPLSNPRRDNDPTEAISQKRNDHQCPNVLPATRRSQTRRTTTSLEIVGTNDIEL